MSELKTTNITKDDLLNNCGDKMFVDGFSEKIYNRLSPQIAKFIERNLYEYCQDFVIRRKEQITEFKENNEQLAHNYILSKKIGGKSDGTITNYELYVNMFIKNIDKPLSEITTNDIRYYLLAIKEEREISDRTLNQIRTVLNGFFTYLHNEGYIRSSPTANIDNIKFEKELVKPYTPYEMELIRMNCATIREKALVETLYSSAMRVGECEILTIDKVSFDKAEVYLFGKGKKHRTSYLNPKAVIYLKQYLESRIDKEPYLFVSMRKPYARLETAGIQKICKNIGKRAGVEDVRPHRFRHTFATDAIAHGMPITDLQAILGHEKIETTMEYVKVLQENVKASYKRCVA